MDISFQPIKRSDFPQLENWLAEPHVKLWWHDELDAAAIEKKYGPRVDGTEPCHVFLIQYKRVPIGLIQYYLWSDYPKHATQLSAVENSAGIDLAIGNPQMVGRGLGSKIIREFLDQVVFKNPLVETVITDPEEKNVQSVRAFTKAGFQVVRSVRLANETNPRSVVLLCKR